MCQPQETLYLFFTYVIDDIRTVEHSYNKPEFPGQTVCYKQEFVISGQFPMRYCSTWLKSLLCYIKKFVIEEFVIRVFHCICIYAVFGGLLTWDQNAWYWVL